MCKNKNKYCMNAQGGEDSLCNYCKKYHSTPEPQKKSKPIAKESEKRKDENKEYIKERKKWLKENNKCLAGLKGCKVVAIHVHHKKGRIGKLLTDTKYWLPVCDSCHRLIEDNPQMAKEKGLSESRLKQ